MSDQKKKRKAWSVQDMVNGRAQDSRPKYTSNYKGPKKSAPSISESSNLYDTASFSLGSSKQNTSTSGFGVNARANRNDDLGFGVGVNKGGSFGNGNMFPRGGMQYRQGGILDYAWILFCAVMIICVVTSLLSFGSSKKKVEGYVYPEYVPTMNGVLNMIYADYRNGGLGSMYLKAQQEQAAAESEAAISGLDQDAMLGQKETVTTPNSTTGATMALDDGTKDANYPAATDFDTLVMQIEHALSVGDVAFVGSKLCYKDENSDSFIGYPQSVIEHFTTYMQNNDDKRANFVASVKNEEEFCALKDGTYLLKLPLLKFTVNMGYDNTTLSISGFSDSKMNSGESAVVSPLLPCMYTVAVSTDSGSQSSEVECNMNEGNLQINIGVTK